jgi:hypothetical protein
VEKIETIETSFGFSRKKLNKTEDVIGNILPGVTEILHSPRQWR